MEDEGVVTGDYTIHTRTHTITRNADGAVMFKGIDWDRVSYGLPPPDFSWQSNLCRLHNWMDGHFMAVWWDGSKWMVATLGDHTVSRLPDGKSGFTFEKDVVPGLKATCDLREHPLKDSIIVTLRDAKFTRDILTGLDKGKCYTFVVSGPSLRSATLTLVDVNSDPTNFGYGVYHVCTRDPRDWSEDPNSIMGIRQPLVRHLVSHKEASENVNNPCMSFIGLVAQETFSGHQTKETARRVVYLNPFWMNVKDLQEAAARGDTKKVNECVMDMILNKEVSYAKARRDLWESVKKHVEPLHKGLIKYVESRLEGIEDEVDREEMEKEILLNSTFDTLLKHALENMEAATE